MALRVMSMAEMRLEVLLEAARSGETVAEVCRRQGIRRPEDGIPRPRLPRSRTLINRYNGRTKSPARAPR
jgi:hypothetical protein